MTVCPGGCIFDSSIMDSSGDFTIDTWTPTLIVVPDGFNIVTGLYCQPQWKPWPHPTNYNGSQWTAPSGLPCQTFLPGNPWPPYPGWPGLDETPTVPPGTSAFVPQRQSPPAMSGFSESPSSSEPDKERSGRKHK